MRKLVSIVILLSLFLLLSFPSYAQRRVTRTPTPTATLRPSRTPTPAPATSTPTHAPSATPLPTATPTPTAATAPTEAPPPTTPQVAVTSPRPGAVLGGVVSIIGTVRINGLQRYVLSVGPGHDPAQWIDIVEIDNTMVLNGRLAFWNTTTLPDGVYVLRLRAIYGAQAPQYQDTYVGPLWLSNAPQTRTPEPTLPPSATPTPTALPTVTPTPLPTLALGDGVSPFLYLTQMDQYDPLCKTWGQRYSIWISNVGMVTVTNLILTDTLPVGFEPVLSDSTAGAQYDGAQSVTWVLGSMSPGEAVKHELEVNIPTWLKPDAWVTNRVIVSCDQASPVESTEQSLVSECPWLKQTAAARPLVLPTLEPSPSTIVAAPSSGAQVITAQGSPGASKPTIAPSPTPVTFAVSEEKVSKSLDILTLVISVGLGILVVLTGVLLYRRLGRRD